MHGSAADPGRSGEGSEPLSDLRSIFRMIFKKLYICVAGSMMGVSAGLLIISIVQPIYRAEMILKEVQTDNPLSSARALYAALEAAGIGEASGQNASRFSRYQTYLTSSEIAQDLIKDEALVRRMFKNSWEPVNGEWEPAASRMLSAKKYMCHALDWECSFNLTPQKLSRILSENVKVVLDPHSDTYYIQVDHPDSLVAIDLLRFLHARADSLVREKDILRSEKTAAQLTVRLDSIKDPTLRESISRNITRQMMTADLARADNIAYTSEVIVPPAIIEKPVRPNIALILGGMMVFGAISGALSVVLFSKKAHG